MANYFYANCFLLLYIISESTFLLAKDSKINSDSFRGSSYNNNNDNNNKNNNNNEDDDGHGNRNSQSRKQHEKIMPENLLAQPSDLNMPVFPERTDAVYFIAAVPGGAKAWGNTLARTLLDIGPPFENPQGPPLRPIFVDLPQKGR